MHTPRRGADVPSLSNFTHSPCCSATCYQASLVFGKHGNFLWAAPCHNQASLLGCWCLANTATSVSCTMSQPSLTSRLSWCLANSCNFLSCATSHAKRYFQRPSAIIGYTTEEVPLCMSTKIGYTIEGALHINVHVHQNWLHHWRGTPYQCACPPKLPLKVSHWPYNLQNVWVCTGQQQKFSSRFKWFGFYVSWCKHCEPLQEKCGPI